MRDRENRFQELSESVCCKHNGERQEKTGVLPQNCSEVYTFCSHHIYSYLLVHWIEECTIHINIVLISCANI